MHALIIPSDLCTLYHEHPQPQANGRFVLDVPALPMGEYDIWIEITTGSGHDNAVLKRFTMQLQGSRPSTDPPAAQVTLEPTKLDIQPPGALSHLEFLIARDGKPVSRFGQFVGVEVHEFAVSADREWFVHDHAHTLGSGKVDAHFHPCSDHAGDMESKPFIAQYNTSRRAQKLVNLLAHLHVRVFTHPASAMSRTQVTLSGYDRAHTRTKVAF